MKIVVSACLLGENCKYNGGNNRSEEVLDFLAGHEVLSVCPECLGGLPVPRVPSEIVESVVTMEDGTVVDREFRLGAELALQQALDFGAELAILQPRSPSCGSSLIYDGTFSKTLIPGQGIFAALCREAGLRVAEPGEWGE